jgi:Ras-related protein Rab-7A
MILGDSGVGKTSILNQYVNKVFTGHYKITIGSDFLTKDLDVGGEKLKLQIWDTAGQEKYRSLGLAYYRGADACMFVYDVTDKTSLANLGSWIETFFTQLPGQSKESFPAIIAGNKCDKSDKLVTEAMAKKWRRSNGNLKHFEVSARTRQGVDEAFEYLGKILCEKSVR